jgi:RNA polymerase sigma-70 factor (ECF subfamily)
MAGLLALLDPDAVMRADGGGQVPTARKPLLGAERIARALIALGRVNARAGRETSGGFAAINGAPGLILDDGEALSVVSLTVDGGRIAAIDIVRNPDKLRHVEVPGS